jgi:hypothetical protein
MTEKTSSEPPSLPDKLQVIQWEVIAFVILGIVYFYFLPTPNECMSINQTWTFFGCAP